MQANLQRILSISRPSRSHAKHGNDIQEALQIHDAVEPGNEREERGRGDLEIHLFQRDAELMPHFHGSVRRLVKRILPDRGIHLHLRETVCKIEPKDLTPSPSTQAERGERGRFDVVCESGLKVECDRIFWVTQASAAAWLKTTGLATDEQGFILVDDTLQSLSHPEVFATGDIATMVNHPRPKAGVFAVRQGKPLFENLQRTLLGKSLKPYKPQRQYLSLIGMGDGRAIATRGFLTLPPLKLLWQWKDWIDRRFMKQFNNF
jgi:NADH dehydrogenase FAD-containing subunit